jgi:hypothetical protein
LLRKRRERVLRNGTPNIAEALISSAFPKYDRNLNTGAPLGVTTEIAVAEQRVYHDEEHLSAVILPIIPAAPEPGEAYEVFIRET